jgi:hypothetical protein
LIIIVTIVTQVLKFISYTRLVYFVELKGLVSFFIWDHFRVCEQPNLCYSDPSIDPFVRKFDNNGFD